MTCFCNVLDTPFEVVKEKEDKSAYAEGFLPSLWYSMEKELNFTTEMRLVNTSRGSKVNATSWSGLMGLLVRGEADLILNSLTMTSSRRAVVDYSVPIVITRTCVLIQTPEYQNRWTLYLKPFSVGVWVTLAGSILLITPSMAWLYWMARYLGTGDSDGYDLLSCLHCVWGMICLQPHNTTPRSWSCRLIFWFSIFMAYVLFYSYSAVFIANMTVRQPDLPFATLEGLLEDGTYMFGVTANTGLFTNFHNATDNVMQRVYRELIVPNINDLPSTYVEGIKRVCDGKFAFMIVFDTALGMLEHVDCSMTVLPNAFFPTTLAMVLRQGLPYRRLLDNTLQRERQTGRMRRLFLLQWLRALPTVDTSYQPVLLEDISPVLNVWMAALTVAVGILLVECALRGSLTFSPCTKVLQRRFPQLHR